MLICAGFSFLDVACMSWFSRRTIPGRVSEIKKQGRKGSGNVWVECGDARGAKWGWMVGAQFVG